MPEEDKPNVKKAVAINLRNLRKSKRLSQAKLADKCGIGVVTIRKIEKGAADPRYSTLAVISKELGVTVDELLTERKTLANVRFRAEFKRDMKDEERLLRSRGQVLADIAKKLELYQWLESVIVSISNASATPPIHFRPYLFNELAQNFKSGGPSNNGVADLSKARKAADEARKVLAKEGILKLRRISTGASGFENDETTEDCQPIHDICGLLESAGFRVLLAVVANNDWWGLSVASDDIWNRPAVVVNDWSRITTERKIFSAAHELGHHIMHLPSFDVSKIEDSKTEEDEANHFASHFLMPGKAFESEWHDAEGHNFAKSVWKVKQIFSVSYKTVLHRIQHEYGLKDVYQRYHRACKYAGFKTRGISSKEEHFPIGKHVFTTDRFPKMVRVALENRAITLIQAAEASGLSIKDMREIRATWIDKSETEVDEKDMVPIA